MRRTIYSVSLLALTAVLLTACGSSDKPKPESTKTETTYPDSDKERLYRYGSLSGGEGGISLLGSKKKDGEMQSGIGVNSFLWRATLDTISFMPLTSADPFGGVIVTDWYTNPQVPSERTKAQVYVLSRELRADAVKVSLFRQVADGKGNWKDAPVAAETNTKLEDAILSRARELRQANMK